MAPDARCGELSSRDRGLDDHRVSGAGFPVAPAGYRMTMEEERTSDTAETFSSQPPPGDPSSQNTEESDAPTGGDPQANRHSSNPQTEKGREGGAGEDSQATGNPSSAG